MEKFWHIFCFILNIMNKLSTSQTDDLQKNDGTDVIEMCLKILDTMPNETMALATLCDAYEQEGDIENAARYMIQLSRIVLAEKDTEKAKTLVEKLKKTTTDDTPGAKDIISELSGLIEQEHTVSPPTSAKPAQKHKKSSYIDEELTLAWNLFQMEELTEEEYSMVAQDLSENAGRNIDIPASVFHVLQDRGFKQLQKIVATLVNRTGIPLISLSNFEISAEITSILPEEFTTRKGAIVFEKMSDDLLVAILNPYAVSLMEEVSTVSGKKCHFFLTTASEYDIALNAIKNA